MSKRWRLGVLSFFFLPLLLSPLLLLPRRDSQQDVQMKILVSDIDHQLLVSVVSHVLGKDYMAAWGESISWPLEGVIMGRSRRVFVAIPVWRRRLASAITIHFLVDTGSPQSSLSHKALEALGLFSPEPRGSVRLWLNGADVQITQSDSKRFPAVNILGADFLKRIRAKVQVNYKNQTLRVYPGIKPENQKDEL